MIRTTLHDIYNRLLAGESFVMEFDTAAEAEQFRVMMHQYKAGQDKAIQDVGMEFDPTAFSFLPVPLHKGGDEMRMVEARKRFKVAFITKKPQRVFKIVDDA